MQQSKSRQIGSEDVIVPGELDLADHDKMNLFFYVYKNGGPNCLPPVIVTRSVYFGFEERKARLYAAEDNITSWAARANEWQLRRTIANIQDLRRAYADFESKVSRAKYYLVEGNHRSAAATLAGAPIVALEIESDSDIAKIRAMESCGEIFEFRRPEKSVKDLVLAFESHILGNEMGSGLSIDRMFTVRERVDALVAAGKVPDYMARWYRGLRGASAEDASSRHSPPG